MKMVFYKAERWIGSVLQIVKVKGRFMFKKFHITNDVVNIVSD